MHNEKDIEKCAGGIVLNHKGQVILVKGSNNRFSLPKGHIEKDEKPIEAATREIYEESGIIDLRLQKYLGIIRRAKKIIHIYLFHTKQKNLNPIDKKIKFARWHNIQEAMSLLYYKEDKDFLLNFSKEEFD
ncbi:MAG: NUDIX domain-containing protein [Promethearchaeia archaeon]